MKYAFSLFLFIVFNSSLFAQNTTKEIEDKFFEKYHKDALKAIDYAFGTNKFIGAKDESIVNLKVKLKDLIDQCGDYNTYEPLVEVSLGQCLKSSSFLVKYERQPIRFTFLFYKSTDKWVVQDFSFDTKLTAEMEDKLKQKTEETIK